MPRRSDDEDDDYDDRPRRRDRVSHSRSAFGTMFGGSMGCLSAIMLCVFVGCGGGLFLMARGCSAVKEKVEEVHQAQVEKDRVEETTALIKNWGEEARFGPLGITLEKLTVGQVSARSPSGRDLLSTDLLLSAHLRFKNYDPNKTVKVEGQSNATLTDEHDNKYKAMAVTTEVGIPAKTTGEIGSGHYIELRSDETGHDVLLFDRPVPGANTLLLTLEAKRYGGTGKLKFTIPRSAWDPKK